MTNWPKTIQCLGSDDMSLSMMSFAGVHDKVHDKVDDKVHDKIHDKVHDGLNFVKKLCGGLLSGLSTNGKVLSCWL